jgi:hypothetical protein
MFADLQRSPGSPCTGMRVKVCSLRLLLLAAPFIALPQASEGATLLDLLQPNATIVSGDKEFYNFRNVTQSGNISADLADIIVIPVIGGPGFPETESGIRFQYGWILAEANQGYNLSLQYNVRTLNASAVIDANTLRVTGGRLGNGSASVSEDVVDSLTTNPVVTKLVAFSPTSSVLQHHVDYPGGPYADLQVSTVFTLSTGDPTASVPVPRAFVSHFDQTFTPVPESTHAILTFGALVVLCRRTGRCRG